MRIQIKIQLLALTLLALAPLARGQGDATNLISDAIIASDPATCRVSQRYYNSVSNLERLCVATNTWSNLGAGTITAITVSGPITGGGTSGSVNLACATCAVTGTGLNQFASTTSAQLFGIISDETGGAGVLVGSASPTFTGTPVLATATATTINKITITQPATGSTLTLIDGKTLKIDNTIELAGTDSAVYTFPSATSTLASIGLTNTFTGRQNSTGAASTAPLKSGTTAAIPATCAVSDLYFSTNATAGQNIFECASTNTWTQQLNSGGGASGYATIQVGGLAVAQETTLNLIAGNGVTPSCVDNSGSTRTDCTLSSNFAVALSIANAQSGKTDYCDDNTGTTSYTCTLGASAVLLSYQAGQRFFLNPSATCSTSCTINIDGVGSRNIKKKDCSTDPGGVLVLNQPQEIWYSGSLFCLVNN